MQSRLQGLGFSFSEIWGKEAAWNCHLGEDGQSTLTAQ